MVDLSFLSPQPSDEPDAVQVTVERSSEGEVQESSVALPEVNPATGIGG